MKAKGTPWVIHTGGGAAGVAARLRTPVYVINLKNPQRLGSREVLVVMEQRQRRHGGRGSHHVLLNSSVNSSQRSVPHKVFGSLHRALLSLTRSSGVGSTKHACPLWGFAPQTVFLEAVGGARRRGGPKKRERAT